MRFHPVLSYTRVTVIGRKGHRGKRPAPLNALPAPVVSTAGIFVDATFLHFLVLPIVGAKNSGFEASSKIISYSSATTLVS